MLTAIAQTPQSTPEVRHNSMTAGLAAAPPSRRWLLSHIVTIRTEVRDREAVGRACRRLELPEPVEGEAKVFTTQKRGLLVRLKDWEFPVVCDLATGQVDFDNFEGHWGDRNRLD